MTGAERGQGTALATSWRRQNRAVSEDTSGATRRLLVHTDMLALEAADRLISGRRHRAALCVNLEPGLMCLGAALAAKVGTVVYGLESPRDGGVAAFERWDESRDANGMRGYVLPRLRGGVLREETALMFREYAGIAEQGGRAATRAHDLAGLAGLTPRFRSNGHQNPVLCSDPPETVFGRRRRPQNRFQSADRDPKPKMKAKPVAAS